MVAGRTLKQAERRRGQPRPRFQFRRPIRHSHPLTPSSRVRRQDRVLHLTGRTAAASPIRPADNPQRWCSWLRPPRHPPRLNAAGETAGRPNRQFHCGCSANFSRPANTHIDLRFNERFATLTCQATNAGIPISSRPIAATNSGCGRPEARQDNSRARPPRNTTPHTVRKRPPRFSMLGTADQRMGAVANQNVLAKRSRCRRWIRIDCCRRAASPGLRSSPPDRRRTGWLPTLPRGSAAACDRRHRPANPCRRPFRSLHAHPRTGKRLGQALRRARRRRDVSANGADSPTAHESVGDVVTMLAQLGANKGSRRGTA